MLSKKGRPAFVLPLPSQHPLTAAALQSTTRQQGLAAPALLPHHPASPCLGSTLPAAQHSPCTSQLLSTPANHAAAVRRRLPPPSRHRGRRQPLTLCCQPPLLPLCRQYGKAKAHVFLDVEMDEVSVRRLQSRLHSPALERLDTARGAAAPPPPLDCPLS